MKGSSRKVLNILKVMLLLRISLEMTHSWVWMILYVCIFDCSSLFLLSFSPSPLQLSLGPQKLSICVCIFCNSEYLMIFPSSPLISFQLNGVGSLLAVQVFSLTHLLPESWVITSVLTISTSDVLFPALPSITEALCSLFQDIRSLILEGCTRSALWQGVLPFSIILFTALPYLLKMMSWQLNIVSHAFLSNLFLSS